MSTSSHAAPSAGSNSTTRFTVWARGDRSAAGPDMSTMASWPRGRYPATTTAAPRSTWVSPWPAAPSSAGPRKPGKIPPPPGPLVRGSTASSTLTIRAESPGAVTESVTEARAGESKQASAPDRSTVSTPACQPQPVPETRFPGPGARAE